MTITADSLAESVLDELVKKNQRGKVTAASWLTFTEFKRITWPKYHHAQHLQVIDDHLQQVELYLSSGGEDGTYRLMFFTPPRHGKSTTISQFFPAYILGLMPDTRLIMTSYGDRLARRNSRAVKRIIESDNYRNLFPHIRLGKNTETEWEIAGYEGGSLSAGVMGPITGEGGQVLIIDDPIKNRAEAESQTYRERLINWYNADFHTRQNAVGDNRPAVIILMMTRWHENDLAGWLLEENVENWHVVTLPALCPDYAPDERPVYEWRQPEEALWEERYPKELILQKRRQMGEYDYSALYDQNPLQARGRLFDTAKVEIVDEAPECIQSVRFYDLAVTAKQSSSFTVGLRMGITKDETIIIEDVWRGQKEFPDVHEIIVQNATIDGRKVAIRLEAEKAGIVALQQMLRESRLRGYKLDAKPPEGDKYTRAGPFASRMNAGKVKLVRGGWNRAFLDECSVFPVGNYADQVDAASGAYQMLSEKGQGKATRVATRGLYSGRKSRDNDRFNP